MQQFKWAKLCVNPHAHSRIIWTESFSHSLLGGITLVKNKSDNAYRFGSLPENAPLAAAYVPMQRSASPAYESNEALSRGTLFPGLDLPFMNIVNNSVAVTPATELQAICFVAHELALYLDTHRDDAEAFAMYQTFLALKQEAHERYVKLYGPVTHSDMLGMEAYAWPDDPWPWDYQRKAEG